MKTKEKKRTEWIKMEPLQSKMDFCSCRNLTRKKKKEESSNRHSRDTSEVWKQMFSSKSCNFTWRVNTCLSNGAPLQTCYSTVIYHYNLSVTSYSWKLQNSTVKKLRLILVILKCRIFFTLWGKYSSVGILTYVLLSFPSTLKSLSSCPFSEKEKTPSQLWFFNVASNSAIKRHGGVSPCSRSPPPPRPAPPSGKTTLGACQRSHDNRDSWPSQGLGMNQT